MRVPALAVLLLALAVSGAPAGAQQGARIDLLEEDGEVRMEGPAPSVSRTFRLLSGTNATFLVLPSHLAREEGGPPLDRSHVAVAQPWDLVAGVPEDHVVTVTGLRNGTYRGHLLLLPEGGRIEEATRVDITIVAAEPGGGTLVPLPGTDAVKLRIVRCGHFLPELRCDLTSGLLPDGDTRGDRELQWRNPTNATAVVKNATIVLNGERNRYHPSAREVEVRGVPAEVPPHGVLTATFVVSRDTIPPDHYTGRIELEVEGRAEPIVVPVEVDVRTGIAVPAALIILGIVLGRLVKYWDAKAKPLLDARAAFGRLEERLVRMQDDDEALLRPQLAELDGHLLRGDLAAFTAGTPVLEARMAALEAVRAMLSTLDLEGRTDQAALRRDLLAARTWVLDRSPEEVKAHLQALRDRFGQRGSPPAGIVLTSAASATALGFERAVARSTMEVEHAAQEVRASSAPGSRVQAAVTFVTGIQPDRRVDTLRWLVRPILYALLLAITIVLGLQALYIDKPTFGAQPLADGLTLIAWGVAADFSTKAISALAAPKTGQ